MSRMSHDAPTAEVVGEGQMARYKCTVGQTAEKPFNVGGRNEVGSLAAWFRAVDLYKTDESKCCGFLEVL